MCERSLSMPAATLFLPSVDETSIKLCGLLRKTGAKIPAGPFRYSDARQ